MFVLFAERPVRYVGHRVLMLLRTLQVEIVQLVNNLEEARRRLGEMRKISYQED